jgi:hypothetical protein
LRLGLLLRRQLFASQLVFLACGLLFVIFGRNASESSRPPPARGQQSRNPLGGACRFGCKSLGVALACQIEPLHVPLVLRCRLRLSGFGTIVKPNNSFKPKLLRSGNGVAG